MPSIPVNREPDETILKHMMEQLYSKRTVTHKLLLALDADGILLYIPLIKWYIEHGLVIDAVYSIIACTLKHILTWFVEQVTDALCTGDVHKKAVFAEFIKLLGNSAFGKLIKALERHIYRSYTKDKLTLI